MYCEETEADPCLEFKTTCKSCSCNPMYLRDLPARKVVKALCNELVMSPQQLGMYMTNFLSAIRNGLKKETNPESTVKCFPTYVQDLPDGSESGKYLVLEFGGCNLRILFIRIENGDHEIDQDGYSITVSMMEGPGQSLFDYIAECLAKFLKERKIHQENLPLGFNFGFPIIQKGLKVGILERWTKGFTCSNVIGHDVVQLLSEAISKRGDIQINIVAVFNETIGTLMACAFKDKDCKIGLIIDNEINCCYVEEQYKAELFDEPDKGSGTVIVNMDSSVFGDKGELKFCRTQYDEELDRASTNPGRHFLEKMIGGIYLGELVRLAVVRFITEGVMFGGKLPDKLNTRGSFKTQFISEIEEDKPCSFKNVSNVCKELGFIHARKEDYEDLRYICTCFSRRAAHMVASLIVVLIRKMNYRKTTIGIDGNLYKDHPHFHNILMHKVRELLIPDTYKFDIKCSEDGSGKGAALVTAVAAKYGQGGDN